VAARAPMEAEVGVGEGDDRWAPRVNESKREIEGGGGFSQRHFGSGEAARA
jgi:hypothetical protein